MGKRRKAISDAVSTTNNVDNTKETTSINQPNIEVEKEKDIPREKRRDRRNKDIHYTNQSPGAFDQDAYNQRVLDKQKREAENNVTVIDYGKTFNNDQRTVTGKITGYDANDMPIIEPNNQIPGSGAALNNAIQSNTPADQTGNTVLKAGVEGGNTAQDVFAAPTIAKEAQIEAEKMQTQNTEVANNEIEAVDNQQTQNVDGSIGAQGAGGAQVQPIAPAAYNAVSGGVQNRPEYTQVATTNQVKNDIANDYNKANQQIPSAVVEKLSIQDYYPEVGKDIAVGTFSGSRIGSQTIYSGAGGLMPMGLYDARKRALQQAAKDKQAALDKYYNGIDIAAQFQPKFTDYVHNQLDTLLYTKHKGNSNAFLADPETRREFARLQAVAKNVTYYDTWAGNILTDAAKDEKFIDPEQVKIAQNIKRALVEDVDGVISGKVDLSKDFEKADVYQNIVPEIDKITAEVLAADKLGERPINMRTGGIYDEEKFVDERDDFMQKLKGGTLKQAEYISGFKKFFTGDYEKIIDGLMESGKYSEAQRQAALDIFAGKLQDKIDLEHVFQDTGALEAMRIAENRRQFNLEYERRIKEGETPWVARNNMMNQVNPNTGKTIQQEFEALKKSGLSGVNLKNKMLQVARTYGYNNAQWDNHMNTIILKENATNYESSNLVKVNPYDAKNRAMVKVYEKTKRGGKDIWVPKTITVNELANSKYGKYHYKDGNNVKPFLSSDIKDYKSAIANNSLRLKPVSYESAWGSVGSQTGNYNPVGTNNIGDYSLDRAINIKNTVGNAAVATLITGPDGKPVLKDGQPQYRASMLKGDVFIQSNISSDLGARTEDSKFGDDKKQFDWGNQGTYSSESSGSYSNQ